MLQYHSRRHRRLMDESEQALLDASRSGSEQDARVSSQVIADSKLHGVWEARHARILLPVAEQRKTAQQIVQLRMLSTTLMHGRALIEYIRDKEIRGDERERFFACHYKLTDYRNAVLAAHRHYLLSVSSHVSTEHLIDLMFDPTSRPSQRVTVLTAPIVRAVSSTSSSSSITACLWGIETATCRRPSARTPPSAEASCSGGTSKAR